MKLSVVSHNTQKGAVRPKLCRFLSKLNPEVHSFVSYACLKFCERKKRKEDETGVFIAKISRLTGTLSTFVSVFVNC